MATKHQVIQLHREHPDWGSTEIAARLGCMPEYVRSTARRQKIKLPSALSARDQLRRQAERIRKIADEAAGVAQHYEAIVAAAKDTWQPRVVPEPQLSRLKSQHWRIIEKWLRQAVNQ